MLCSEVTHAGGDVLMSDEYRTQDRVWHSNVDYV